EVYSFIGIPLNLAIYIIRNTYFILNKKRAISMAPKHRFIYISIDFLIYLLYTITIKIYGGVAKW
ncbi:hypothetical protein, partial [Brachyspira pilosicoli]